MQIQDNNAKLIPIQSMTVPAHAGRSDVCKKRLEKLLFDATRLSEC
jgi:hypothetical protein